MHESTVTAKGQTTVPKEVRAALNLSSGDRIRYLVLPGGEVRLVKAGSVARLQGILAKSDRKPVSLKEMDDAIAQGSRG